MAGPIVSFCLRVVLAAIFIAAAVPKLSDPAAFALMIDRYKLLPWSGASLVALYLPWVEAITAIALFIRPMRASAALLACVLSFIFSAVLASAWARGLTIDCGCFGAASGTSVPWAFGRALALFVGSLVVARLEIARPRQSYATQRVPYLRLRR